MSRVRLFIDTTRTEVPERARPRGYVDTPRVASARSVVSLTDLLNALNLSPQQPPAESPFELPTMLDRFPTTPPATNDAPRRRFLFAPRKPSPQPKSAMQD
jgi:hypothetical protein